MKKLSTAIYMLLFCVFLQDNTAMVDSFKEVLFNSKNDSSLFMKKTDSTEEDTEESENETKEKEKEEKEKELKDFTKLSGYTYLSLMEKLSHSYNMDDDIIFSLNFETETPPPKA